MRDEFFDALVGVAEGVDGFGFGGDFPEGADVGARVEGGARFRGAG